jgi:hypothetical protein
VRDEFLERKHINGPAIPEMWQKEWQETIRTRKTLPKLYKHRFLSWIGYWPWSLVWTLINDPLKRIVRRIYYELQGVYQRITDRVWKG